MTPFGLPPQSDLPNVYQPRYTPGRFRDCPWCYGRGCAACDGEAEKAYKRQFPNGPQPVATFDTRTQQGRDGLRNMVGSELADQLLHLADRNQP